MQIEIELLRDGIEGEVTAFDSEGNEVQVSKLIIKPYFFQSGAPISAAYCAVVDKAGQPITRSTMLLSASSGKIHMASRNSTTEPAYYKRGTPEEQPKSNKRVTKEKVRDRPDPAEDKG